MYPKLVRQTVLVQDLKERHVNMLPFTACIGFGLSLKSGTAIYLAGPGLECIATVVAASIMWSVIAALGEMTTLFPVQGPLFEFPCRFLDEGVGSAWVATIAAELVAVSNLITFNFPEDYLATVGYPEKSLGWSTRHDSPAVWVVTFLVVIDLMNMLPVGYYGALEDIFRSIKTIFISGLIMFNLILSGAQKVKTFSHGDHWFPWNSPYSFASKGIEVKAHLLGGSTGQSLALWTAVTSFGWSLVGFESIAVTAAENQDLERRETTRLASKKSFLRVTLLYTLSTFAVSLNVLSDDAMLRDLQATSIPAGLNSAFIIAAVRNHLRGWPSLFNGFFIFSAASSAMNALYVSSRMLHALASIPEVWPLLAQNFRKRLERTSSRVVPIATVITSWLFGLLAFLAARGFRSIVLGRITQNATVSFFIVYGVICASYINFYHKITIASGDATVENHAHYNCDDSQYPYRTHGQLFRSWYGVGLCTLIVIINGWRAFYPPFNTADFIVSDIGIIAFLVIFAVYHIRSDGWSPLKWRLHASMQTHRPPPRIVVSGRRRGHLTLTNHKSLLAHENVQALAKWIWVWLK